MGTSRSNNPLIQAPHVPQRAPQWSEFLNTSDAGGQQHAAVGHNVKQPLKKGARGLWSQARNSPYQEPFSQQSGGGGPLTPAWVQKHKQETEHKHDQQQEQQLHILADPLNTSVQQRPPQPPHPVGQGTSPAQSQHGYHAAATAAAQSRSGQTAGAAGVAGGRWALSSAQRGLGGGDAAVCSNGTGVLSGGLPGSSSASGLPAQHPWGCHQQQHQQHQQHQQQQHQTMQQRKLGQGLPHAQPPTLHQQHQQQAYAKPRPLLPVWDMELDDDDDDVQLPDSWWDRGQQEPGTTNQPAGHPGAAAAAGRPAAQWPMAAALHDRANKQHAWQRPGLQQQQQWHEQQQQPQQGMWQQPVPVPPQQTHPAGEHAEEAPDGFGQPTQQHNTPHLWPPHGQPVTTNHQVLDQQTGRHHQTHMQQQPQQQRSHQPQQCTAAASLWSGGVNLASLSRVSAGAAAAAAALGTRTGPSDTAALAGGSKLGSTGPAPQRSSSIAAQAAAASADTASDIGRKKGSRVGNKGSKAAKGKQLRSLTSGNIVTVEFVPKAPGDTATQQPKLHQTTLFDTLKRAQQNKQREQQQQEMDDFEQQDDAEQDGFDSTHKQAIHKNGNSDAAAATAAGQQPVRKRKRSTVAAADAAAAASGGDTRGARCAASGGRGRRTSRTAVALEGAVEELDTWHVSNSAVLTAPQQEQRGGHIIIDATFAGTAGWQQLQQELASAEGVALGLLYSRTVVLPGSHDSSAAALTPPLAVQYFTSLQQPSKQQQLLLSKAAAVAKKQAASTAAADADAAGKDEAGQQASQEGPDTTTGMQQVVGLAVMPVPPGSTNSSGTAAASRGSPSAALHTYVVLLQRPQQQATVLPPHVLQLLQALLCDPGQRPCVLCGAKAVLCCLAQQGLQLPAAGCACLVDPELLGWLLDPQHIQDTKQEACYSLKQQLVRCGHQMVGVGELGPLQRLHHQLQQSLQLVGLLQPQLGRAGGVAGQAIKLEMQVAAILAKMEACGVACAPTVLSDHRATLAARLAAIKGRATQLVGHELNLSSSSQLAKVLYEELRLTPPAGAGGRAAAKTHLPTHEAALKQLAASHELPSLVLEHRCIMNVLSKWIDAQWVQQAAGGRVHCTWQQASTATGRLSSCGPNLQAVTKYTITAQDSSRAGGAAAAAAGSSAQGSSPLLTINVRDAFVAPAGKLLLSADYSQIELRLLAHFSEDQLLRQILGQSTGDVFNMIAAVLRQAGTRGTAATSTAAPGVSQQVSPEERERAKRVVYGMVYGQTAYGLAAQLADQGVNTATAQGLIDGFLARFPGVRSFMERSISAAQRSGAVSTLMGRHRPLHGLIAPDAQDRSAAARKVVNSQIQGSAADLIKLAMCAWDSWDAQARQQQQQQQPERPVQSMTAHAQQARGGSSPGSHAQLIAQIHDELLFEVDAADAVVGPDGTLQHPGQHFLQVAAAVKRIMEGAAPLTMPLRVKLAWGHSWGSLADLQL